LEILAIAESMARSARRSDPGQSAIVAGENIVEHVGRSWRIKMWKVGDVEPVKVLGANGYPYGFNITTETGKPVVSGRKCIGERLATGGLS
jgi:hypothetical protein